MSITFFTKSLTTIDPHTLPRSEKRRLRNTFDRSNTQVSGNAFMLHWLSICKLRLKLKPRSKDFQPWLGYIDREYYLNWYARKNRNLIIGDSCNKYRVPWDSRNPNDLSSTPDLPNCLMPTFLLEVLRLYNRPIKNGRIRFKASHSLHLRPPNRTMLLLGYTLPHQNYLDGQMPTIDQKGVDSEILHALCRSLIGEYLKVYHYTENRLLINYLKSEFNLWNL